MKIRSVSALLFALGLTYGTLAQDASSAPPAVQNAGGGGGRYGQRGGRGGFGGGMGMAGRGLMGTVTEVAADHYTIKTDAGDVYTVHLSANTRIFKMSAGTGGQGGGQDRGQGGGQGRGMGYGGNPPQPLKATDIKTGDVLEVRGETDAAAKSVGAVAIVQLDPERVKQIRDMEANYGKTWLMGKVTAIDGVKVTVMGAADNALHSFVADENTTFRRRRDPITLADIQVGDTVRADGAVKDGAFTAATVGVVGVVQAETPAVPRTAPPQ